MSGRAAVFVLAALTLLAAALATGAAIYYLLLGVMLTMLALALLSVVITLLTLRVSVHGPSGTVERGVQVHLTLDVRHACPLPVRSAALELRAPGEDDAQSVIEVSAPPLLRRHYECDFVCPHRGLYSVGVSGVRVTDVFSLFTLGKKLHGRQTQVEVCPRTRRILPISLDPVDAGPEHVSRQSEDNASPSDVRAWVQGDALKKIHWKLSMKKRELLVRTYEESARPDALILCDLYPISGTPGQALSCEDAVCELAASAALAQLRAGYPVRMPLNSRNPLEITGSAPVEISRFVDALMRVRFDSPYPFEQVLALETRRLQRTGGAVLITTRLTPRIADAALRLRRTGVQVMVGWVTDSRRPEALELLGRLAAENVRALRVDPWAERWEQVE